MTVVDPEIKCHNCRASSLHQAQLADEGCSIDTGDSPDSAHT
ncbi:hypothetical protein [Thiolapillus sp.]